VKIAILVMICTLFYGCKDQEAIEESPFDDTVQEWIFKIEGTENLKVKVEEYWVNETNSEIEAATSIVTIPYSKVIQTKSCHFEVSALKKQSLYSLPHNVNLKLYYKGIEIQSVYSSTDPFIGAGLGPLQIK